LDLQRSPMDAFGLDVDKFLDFLPSDCPPDFSQLALECCLHDPESRPTFRMVVKRLGALVKKLPEDDASLSNSRTAPLNSPVKTPIRVVNTPPPQPVKQTSAERKPPLPKENPPLIKAATTGMARGGGATPGPVTTMTPPSWNRRSLNSNSLNSTDKPVSPKTSVNQQKPATANQQKPTELPRGPSKTINIATTSNSKSVDGYVPYDVLRNNPPVHVDKANLQNYLSPTDFQQVLHMDKATFDKLPKWKQQDIKRRAGLF